MLMLVKPQFELQPGQVGKGGIVTDAACTRWSSSASVQRTRRWACGQDYFASSISGGDGNQEFFIHSTRAQE
jgi:23S rRNA (cytidine1920-2'-O)/16S rRNA (cytidine1409-2'-O)-methyltransferase